MHFSSMRNINKTHFICAENLLNRRFVCDAVVPIKWDFIFSIIFFFLNFWRSSQQKPIQNEIPNNLKMHPMDSQCVCLICSNKMKKKRENLIKLRLRNGENTERAYFGMSMSAAIWKCLEQMPQQRGCTYYLYVSPVFRPRETQRTARINSVWLSSVWSPVDLKQ